MRVVAVHGDVVVATSRFWQTNCTLLRNGAEAFCVDSPVLPDELELLPTVAEQMEFTIVGLLATHGDWDHVLGRYAFGEAPLGVPESTKLRMDGDPGSAQRELRDFDDEHYVVRDRPLALGDVQTLPVPGHLGLGEGELELHQTSGHTPDGMAIWVPWANVLIAGDYLSPVEIPMVEHSVTAYLETLDRLEPLVEHAETVIPGHGEVLESERALAILREDRDYLHALRADGAGAKLPLARNTGAQKKIHAANAAKLQGRPAT